MRDPQAQDAHAAALETLCEGLNGPCTCYSHPTEPCSYCSAVTGLKQAALDARSRLVVLEQERDEARDLCGRAFVVFRGLAIRGLGDVTAQRWCDSMVEILDPERRAVSVADIPQEDTE